MFEPPGLTKQTHMIDDIKFHDSPEKSQFLYTDIQKRYLLEVTANTMTMTPSSYNGLRFEDDFTSVMSHIVNQDIASTLADLRIDSDTQVSSHRNSLKKGFSLDINNIIQDQQPKPRQNREKTKTAQPQSLTNITEDQGSDSRQQSDFSSPIQLPSMEDTDKLKMNVFDEIKNVWGRKDVGDIKYQYPSVVVHDYDQMQTQKVIDHNQEIQQRNLKNLQYQQKQKLTNQQLNPQSIYNQPISMAMLQFQQQSQIEFWNQQQQFEHFQDQNKLFNMYHDAQKIQNPYEQFEINEDLNLKNQIDKLWANQLVSRQLQKLLECGREDQKEIIVSHLERMCPQIAKDIFGNYVVQKVFEKCNDALREKLFTKLTPYFYDLSKNTFGCRVMQKVINFVNKQDTLQDVMIRSISDNYKTLIYDDFGNYVLHKMLETFPATKLQALIQVTATSFAYMIQQPYGCKIIVRILEIYPKPQLFGIYEQAFLNMKNLIQSEGGNYVVQQLLKTCPEYQQPIKEYMMPYFCYHSKNKYTSNTMEKLLDLMNQDELSSLTIYLIHNQIAFDTNKLISMCTDLATNASANYVIKKLIIQCDQQSQKPLLDFLRSNPQELRMIKASQYGQKIAALLEQLLKQN